MSANNKRVKVFVIDDSALVRKMLTQMLNADDSVEVVGAASDPYMARERIKVLNPDVLTLDVEMPKMDGLTFLENLMRLRPMPVVMISSLTERNAEITLKALELGAIDFICKPSLDVAYTFNDYSQEICAKVLAAAEAGRRNSFARFSSPGSTATEQAYTVDQVLSPLPILHSAPGKNARTICAVGASTGGTEAIKFVLSMLSNISAGIVIAQHIPEHFSKLFAQHADACTALRVCEAEDGQPILPGHAYVAPGNRHLVVVREGAGYICRLNENLPVNRHRPSVDVLFRSVAHAAGRNAVGVLLTGMGNDGACGLLELRRVGASTIAQDESSSVVWGMPGEAVKLHAAEHVTPLDRIASQLTECLHARHRMARSRHVSDPVLHTEV